MYVLQTDTAHKASLPATRLEHFHHSTAMSDLFILRTDTMRSFCTQQDHLGVLNYVINCLNFMNI